MPGFCEGMVSGRVTSKELHFFFYSAPGGEGGRGFDISHFGHFFLTFDIPEKYFDITDSKFVCILKFRISSPKF